MAFQILKVQFYFWKKRPLKQNQNLEVWVSLGAIFTELITMEKTYLQMAQMIRLECSEWHGPVVVTKTIYM